MEDMALYRHYPNWMRSQALTNIMNEYGYGDSSEFTEALSRGDVPQEVLAQIKDVNAKAKMFHPTLAWASYDDTEDFDAMMHAQEQRTRELGSEQAQGPLRPSTRVGIPQPTVGPQPQPQMQGAMRNPTMPQMPASNVPPSKQPLGFDDARQRLPSQVANFPEQFPPLPDEDSQ